MKTITWEEILSGKHERDSEEDQPGVRVVVSPQLLEKLKKAGYKWRDGQEVDCIDPGKNPSWQGDESNYLYISSGIKRLLYGTVEWANEGEELWKLASSSSSNTLSSSASDTCPLCGSPGDDLIFNFYCSNQKCSNFYE